MTTEEAAQRLANGERPDIISFPLGFPVQSLLWQNCPNPPRGLLPSLSDTAKCQGAILAYPYMMNFYTLTLNQEAPASPLVPRFPFGTQLPHCEFNYLVYSAQQGWAEEDACALSYSEIYGTSPFLALEHFREEGELDLFSQAPPEGYAPDLSSFSSDGSERFLNGKSALLLSPAADYEKLLLDRRANSLSLATFGFSDYTDLVQLVGVCSTEDPARQAMCQEFANTFT